MRIGPAASLLLASAAYAAQPGCVGEYRFETGNCGCVGTDTSGAANPITGGLSFHTNGYNGTAILFDGRTILFASVPDAPSLDLTTGMTLEAFVSPSGNPTPLALGKGTDYQLTLDGATEVPCCEAAGASVCSLFIVMRNTWTHLACTYDGSTLTFYRNGSVDTSVAASGPITVSSEPFAFGSGFAGRLDDVRIYNRALTQAEIKADMTTP